MYYLKIEKKHNRPDAASGQVPKPTSKPRRLIQILFALSIIFISSSFSYALVFCDSAKSLYYFESNKAQKSDDSGLTWNNIDFPATFESNSVIAENSDKKIYIFWVKNDSLFVSESNYSNSVFSKPKKILTGFVAEKFNVLVINGIWKIFYSDDGDISYLSSADKGQTFSQVQLLNSQNKASDWIVGSNNGNIRLYYSSDKNIYSLNPESSFNNAKLVLFTDNIIDRFVPFRYPFLPNSDELCWVEKNMNNRSKILLLPENAKLPIVLHETNNIIQSAEAKQLDNSIFLTYAEVSFGKVSNYLLKARNDGGKINDPQLLSNPADNSVEILGSFLIDNKFLLLKKTPINPLERSIIDININAPQISVTSPGKSAVFRNGSTISISAKIIAYANNLTDESVADIFLDNVKLPDGLVFFADDLSLTGLIKLPESISEGQHLLTVKLTDLADNVGISKLNIFIDKTPPQVDRKYISGAFNGVVIPYFENGSGFDYSLSYLKLYSGSTEVSGKTQFSSSSIAFIPSTPLAEGTYLLEYSLRDLVGNSLSKETSSLNISSFSSAVIQQMASSDVGIVNLENGPNPFHPLSNDIHYVKYQLKKLTDIELIVFSLSGGIIRQIKDFASSLLGSIAWDGRDYNGNYLPRGVYPFIFLTKDDTGKESRRGKIIIY